MIALSRPGFQINESVRNGVWPALTVVILIAAYPILRYGGWFSLGGDTLNFTIAIRGVLETGDLNPVGYQVYPNGYGFQALSVFLINVTGVGLAEWQVFGGVLMIAWVVFPAWLLYREWVGTGRGASLAVVLLFAQPDFLFGIMRGTHEKFTRGLILLSLYLLIKSLRSRDEPRRFAVSVIALYLTLYGLISYNNFFSSSFITAMLLALGLTWFVTRQARSDDSSTLAIRRMAHVVAVSLVLSIVYTFYIYDPAKQQLLVLNSIGDQIGALFLQVESSEAYTNPYSAPVLRAWISPYVFLVLSLANWLLLFIAGAIWTHQGVQWLWKRQRPTSNVDLLLWAFFGAFAIQGALAVLIDVSGALAGNVQHRMIPTIGLVGAPLIARWLLSSLQSVRQSSAARLAYAAIWSSVGVLMLLAVAKATNEPVLSNQWQVYSPAEIKAANWAEQTLAGQSLWVGFDRRLIEAIDIRSGAAPRDLILDRFDVDQETRDFLISDVIRVQAQRTNAALPIKFDDFVTFDNGDVQIFHRRPESPYHR